MCTGASRAFGNESVGKPDPQRLVGGNPPPGQHQIGRAVQPDPARQQLGTTAAWNQAKTLPRAVRRRRD